MKAKVEPVMRSQWLMISLLIPPGWVRAASVRDLQDFASNSLMPAME